MIQINYITDEISYIIKKSIIKLFPSLNDKHVQLILKYISKIINLIFLKTTTKDDSDGRWYLLKYLIIKNNSGLNALILLLLPFINEKESKKDIINLNDIYTKKKSKHNFQIEETIYKYSNLQYSRCKRNINNIEEYKFNEKDIEDNFLLLCYTIDKCINKLYVNWLHIKPIQIKKNWYDYEIDYYDNEIFNVFYENHKTLLFTDFENDFLNNSLEFNNEDIDLKNKYLNNMGENVLPYNISDMWETFNNDFVINTKEISFLFKTVHPSGFRILKKKMSIPKFNDEELPLIIYLNKELDLSYIIENISWYDLTKKERDRYFYKWTNIKKKKII